MTYVPAMNEEGSYPLAVGAPSDIYGGRAVFVSRGYDFDPTQMRGYGRSPGREIVHRPGAYTPAVGRTSVGLDRPWWVGTQNTHGALAKIRADWESNGPVGTRHAHVTPPPAGLNRRSRIPLSNTPAMGVFESAVAATGGMMRLAGTFTAPYGAVPPGIRNAYTPLPPGPIPVQTVGAAPSPVGCLPGTPGCYLGPGGAIQPNQRAPWGAIQNQGPLLSAASTPPPAASPLPGAGNTTQPITLPANHPGRTHVLNEGGVPSYTESPAYPQVSTPFGYQGGSRVSAPSAPPSGADLITSGDPDIAAIFKSKKALAVGGAVVAGILLIRGVTKRRRSRRSA